MRTLFFFALAVTVGCGTSEAKTPDLGAPPAPATTPPTAGPSDTDLNPRLLRRFRPLREGVDPSDTVETGMVVLGKALFFDKRLSRAGDVSCNSCHPLDQSGADQRTTSTGDQGKTGTRNAPTVLNAAWHVAQFWDGRAADIEEQAKGPILNPAEMAMRGPDQVTAVLRSIPGYGPLFATAFPDDKGLISFDNAARAIGAFERTLATPSRWDEFLKGKHDALTPAEIEGIKLFADIGCVQCHTGELVGGSMFQKVGVASPWPNQKDQGRYAVTKQAADRMVFKVPSLRNVAETAPYFHDGSVKELGDAVRMMAVHQLGMELTDEETASIVTWLGSLTGTTPPEAQTPPELPADGPTTAGVMAKQK
jgi:cytochrome c peroxidase